MIYKLIIPELSTLSKFHDIAKNLLKEFKIDVVDFNPGSIVIEFWGDFKEIYFFFFKHHYEIKKIIEYKHDNLENFRFQSFLVQGLQHPGDVENLKKLLMKYKGIRKVEVIFHLNIIRIFYHTKITNLKNIKRAIRKSGLSIEITLSNHNKLNLFDFRCYQEWL